MAHCCLKTYKHWIENWKIGASHEKRKTFQCMMKLICLGTHQYDSHFYHFCGFKPLGFPVLNSFEGQIDTNCKKLKKNQNQNPRVD